MNRTLKTKTAQRAQNSSALGENQSAEEISNKTMLFFEQPEALLVRREVDEGIQRGLADIRVGRTTPLPSSGSLDSFVDSILK